MPGSSLSFRHGALLVGVFLTALAGIERASAQYPWAYLSPLLAVAGGVWMLFAPFANQPLLLLLGAAVLLLLFNVLNARGRPAMSATCRIVGALCLLVGNALLFPGMPSHVVTAWWIGFVLFSLLGSHLEKGDISIGGKERIFLLVLLVLAPVGAVLKNYALGAEFIDPQGLAPWQRWAGDRLIGLVMTSAALWLWCRDASASWSRLCVLGGCVWLGVAGLIALYTGEILAGPIYDATVHAFFIGFAVSLVLARFQLNNFLALGGLALLYLSLALWIVSSLATWPMGRELGALLSTVALLLLTGITLRTGKADYLAPSQKAPVLYK